MIDFIYQWYTYQASQIIDSEYKNKIFPTVYQEYFSALNVRSSFSSTKRFENEDLV